MGKGDKKTKRGKIIAGTYGVRRPRKKTKTIFEQKEAELKTDKKSAEPVKSKPPRRKQEKKAEEVQKAVKKADSVKPESQKIEKATEEVKKEQEKVAAKKPASAPAEKESKTAA
ncbi:MAG: 30S ribosomal protein THX, partial [Bacteroidales bacterium]|nr:30S ribosomal protein THX [Bacteroidales bacterium]